MAFLEDYTLLEELGQGAFATVYKVRHNKLGYIRAVRVLNKVISQGESDPSYQKFLEECILLLRLGNGNHPNIVHIYQPLLKDQHAVVEMDYVDGQDIFHYMDSHGSFVEIDEVMHLLKDIGGALAYCHEDIYEYCMDRDVDHLQTDPNDGSKVLIDEATKHRLIQKYQVVHNDLHPGNIMRKRNGGYILLDFGLAIEGNTVVRSSRKKNGVPEYKSPEKWRNESHISTQSDIYSFGVILYTMLAGRPPFKLDAEKFGSFGAEQHLYQALLNEAPPAIYTYRKEAFEAAHPGQTYEKDYPDWLEALILKCLEKKVEDRFQGGKALMVFMNEKELLRSARNYENLKEAFDAAHFGLTNGKEYLEWLEAFILKNLDTRLNHQVYHDRLEAFILKCVKKEMDRLKSGKNPVASEQEPDVNSDGEPPVDNPFENGYEYVDLGLSVKWATCNVGADSPEDYGDYFAWGETGPKQIYDWSHYKWGNYKWYIGANMEKYTRKDRKIQLDLSDDAACANWGGRWRIPTHDEFKELREKCNWAWITQNGVKGYKVTSEINGNSIFLPVAGCYDDSSLYCKGKYGYYWSSSLYADNVSNACWLAFNKVDWRYFRRYYGLSVRPVCP